MRKIIITPVGPGKNKGTIALLKTRIDELNRVFPDVKFTLLAEHPELTPDFGYDNVKIRQGIGKSKSRRGRWAEMLLSTLLSVLCFFLIKIGLNPDRFLTDKLREYYEADLIVTSGGDNLTEYYGFIFNALKLLCGILLNTPVAIYAESVGPFNHFLNRMVGKFLFSRCKILTTREKLSKKVLHDLIGDNYPVYVTADSAFLLEPVSKRRIAELLKTEKIDRTDTLIGLSVSKLISKYGFPDLDSLKAKYEKFVSIMARSIDCIIKNLDGRAVFVPHCTQPGDDDRTVARDIFRLIENKSRLNLIEKDYRPEELKGIIGEFDLFIGARMHSTIASTSMGIPTIILAYCNKAYGVIGEMLGYDHVLDIKNLSSEKLVRTVNKIWAEREELKGRLNKEIKTVRKRAAKTSEIIKEVLSKL